MKPLSPEQRRGLRMAAQVACALSLLAAGAGTSLAKGTEPSTGGAPAEGASLEHTADVLRLHGQGGGCFQPPSWGPLAPCEAQDPLFTSFLATEAA
jgi:hypothetical protein